ncbi:MAG: hypothetical protein EA409_01960 [Saprospirales bacterium]|nr:MAG: hypothetical protein EA409_01960 [Saprospirales bacterium]
MKPIYCFAFIIGLGVFAVSCAKELVGDEFPHGIELPDSVDFGKSLIYRNGELWDYEPRLYNFVNRGDKGRFSIFFFFQQETSLWHQFVISRIPADTGYYEIPSVGFIQVISEDLFGYSYQLKDDVNSFIQLTKIDTIERKVAGTFQVRYVRRSKNGHRLDLGLPKHLLFQGVFYDYYTER